MKKWTLKVYHNTTLNFYIKEHYYHFYVFAYIEKVLTQFFEGYECEILETIK